MAKTSNPTQILKKTFMLPCCFPTVSWAGFYFLKHNPWGRSHLSPHLAPLPFVVGSTRASYHCSLPFLYSEARPDEGENFPLYHSNVCCAVLSCSVMSNFGTLQIVASPASSVHGILQARILEWGRFLQGIFLTQGSNFSLLCLLHWQAGSLPHGKSIP